MNHLCRVHELEAFHELVENVPVVSIFEYFLSDSVVQIGFHELKHKIKILVILGFDDIVQLDDIGMVELMEEDNFPVGSLGVCGVLKGIKDFFECCELIGFFVSNFPYMSIGPASYFFDEIISL